MLIREYSYNSRRVEKIIEDLQHQIYGQNQNVFNIFQSIKTALSGFEVLYLPTYRRVELALRREQNDARNKKKAPRFDVEPNGLFTGDIQFGLTDISDRLREINRKIVFDSNHQYRSISAAIINDLIDGTYETAELSSSIPKKEDLELLFSRVAQGRREVGAHFAVNIPNLEKIYSNKGVPKSSEKFLNYFLTQIDKVINSTRNVETRVQEFIDRCNAYLSMEEISTQFDEKDMIASVDGKRLILNKENLHVKVVTIPDERPVSLDALSSGEKQMISLFAKLYLYEAPKIVLIDEPELSLSIEWQKKILVDIVKSPMCEQLIAITHSPFVFDNELDSFAGSLHVSVNPVVVLFDEDEGKAFDVDGFDE
jgi:hypothetical protein